MMQLHNKNFIRYRSKTLVDTKQQRQQFADLRSHKHA